MYYGYALYYKDKDGFELPLFHRNSSQELVVITPYKEIAQKWFDDEHETLKNELNPKPVKVVTGFWFWKKEMNFPGRLLSNEEFKFKAQVFNTLFIKKVKLV